MGKHWTQEEDELLKQLYPDSDLDSLLVAFPERPVSSIANRAHILRLTKSIVWKENFIQSKIKPKQPKPPKLPKPQRQFSAFRPFEKQIIIDFAPVLTIVELKTLLPRRTSSEIVKMAQSMGVDILALKRRSLVRKP